MTTPAWRPMQAADLAAVNAIADQVHQTYPEDPQVFTERLALFPAGCRVAAAGEQVLGYAVAHPWELRPPSLDSLLISIPKQAACLYLHDVALLPSTRGAGLGETLILDLLVLARTLGAPRLALTAVYETPRYWARFGFTPHRTPEIDVKLASYGPTAEFMVRPLERADT